MSRDDLPLLDRREYLFLSGVGLTSVAGCSETGELTLPANFRISDIEAPENVTVGERFTIRANVTNAGDENGTANITVRHNGSIIKTARPDLRPNESITIPIEQQPNRSGEWTVQIEAGDATQSVTVPVRTSTSAEFALADSALPSSVTAGEPFIVRATVENQGNGAGSATLVVGVNNETVAETDVALEAGASKTVRVTHTITSSGSVPISVQVGEESTSDTLSVAEPEEAAFEITNLEAPSSLLAGDSASIEATIQNAGDLEGETSVALIIDGANVTSQTVSLQPDATKTVSFSPTIESAGDHTVAIETADGSLSRTLTADKPEPAYFSLSDFSGPSEATEAVTARVSARVANTGQVTDTKPVELVVDGSTVDSKAFKLGHGEWADLTLAWDPSSPGTYEYVLRTPDDSITRTIEVTAADAPSDALDAARTRLVSVGESLITTIENDFVGQHGSMVDASWGDLETDLQWVSDKIDEAEGNLNDVSGSTDDLEARIATLRNARSALYALGSSTGAGDAAFTLYASLRSSLDGEPSMSSMSTYKQYLDQANEGLANATQSLQTAQNRLDQLDSRWLQEFESDLAPATTLREASSDFETALDTLDSRLNTARLDTTRVALDAARTTLVTTTDQAHSEIQSGFLTDPRSGVDVATGTLSAKLQTAQDRLTTADNLLQSATTDGTDIPARRSNLGKAHAGLDSLVTSMGDAETGFNKITDAAALISVDSLDKSVTLIKEGSRKLAQATSHFQDAKASFAKLSDSWVSGFDAALESGQLSTILTSFDLALTAAEILMNGINRLLDMGAPLEDANTAYENGKFDTAATRFRDAKSIAADANDILSNQPSDLPTDLSVMIEVGACRARHLRNAMELFAESAELAGDGKKQKAKERSDEAYAEANATCP